MEHLAWIRTLPGGDEWLEAAPRLAADAAEEWGVELGPPFAGGMVSLVLPAGDDAVLKVKFPHGEDEHEAEARSTRSRSAVSASWASRHSSGRSSSATRSPTCSTASTA